MAGKTAIAAGGTHPTGMHSCLQFIDMNRNLKWLSSQRGFRCKQVNGKEKV